MRTSISKPLTFVVISVLVVALVYVSISALNVFAAPNKAPPNADCVLEDVPGVTDKVQTCCWTEMTYGSSFAVKFCQHCNSDGTGCGLKTQIGLTSPPSGPVAPLQGGVLEQPPTPPPTGPAAPLQEGVLEQLQNDQPPLFGRNEAAVPPTGGIEQPFTTTTPPLFGNIPQGGGFGVLQESETPPTFGQVAPLTDEEEAQVQEPDEQISEEDGQVIAKDEDEDDDDGPVPPECPTTGPIPPDCTLKPKFPDERAIE